MGEGDERGEDYGSLLVITNSICWVALTTQPFSQDSQNWLQGGNIWCSCLRALHIVCISTLCLSFCGALSLNSHQMNHFECVICFLRDWSNAIRWDRTENDQYIPVRVSFVPGMYMCENARAYGSWCKRVTVKKVWQTGFKKEFPDIGLYKYLRRWGQHWDHCWSVEWEEMIFSSLSDFNSIPRLWSRLKNF